MYNEKKTLIFFNDCVITYLKLENYFYWDLKLVLFFFNFKIKMEPKHPLLIALGEISGEDYVLETLKKTKPRWFIE